MVAVADRGHEAPAIAAKVLDGALAGEVPLVCHQDQQHEDEEADDHADGEALEAPVRGLVRHCGPRETHGRAWGLAVEKRDGCGDKAKSGGLRADSVPEEEPRAVLARLGVRPSRSRGQHFLTDARVAERAIRHADVGASDVVLEIGPGLGVLTRRLVERARHVVAIESDRRFAAYLQKAVPRAEIVHGDGLKVPWPAFDVMVSNLPYQISSPLTFRLLETPFDRAVLMYQWEFARRMVAAPGTPDYSRLSVGVYVRAACTVLERVPRNAFHPQPKVSSALVRLEPRPCPFPLDDPAAFDAVVAALFEHRRKTVANGLRLAWRAFTATPEALEARMDGLPFGERRVEELRPEEIEAVTRAVVGAKA